MSISPRSQPLLIGVTAHADGSKACAIWLQTKMLTGCAELQAHVRTKGGGLHACTQGQIIPWNPTPADEAEADNCFPFQVSA